MKTQTVQAPPEAHAIAGFDLEPEQLQSPSPVSLQGVVVGWLKQQAPPTSDQLQKVLTTLRERSDRSSIWQTINLCITAITESR